MMSAVRSTWLSHEPLPRGWRVLPAVVVGALLLAAPWTGVAGGLDFAAQVLLLSVLASCHELVAGRGGVTSFLHGPFAVVGAAGVAVAASRLGAGPVVVLGGLSAGIVLAVALNAVVAGVAWRSGRWIFALASLAVASWLPLLGSRWGLLAEGAPIGFAPMLGPQAGYAALATVSVVLWLLLMRVANSPFGRVLPALRDDPLLAQTIGLKPALYQTLATSIAAVVAVAAGAAFALRQGGSLPLVAGCLDLAMQVLLVGWVGGLRTLWAPPVGAVVVLAAWRALPMLFAIGAARVPDVPWLVMALTEPASQRWLMFAVIGVLGWMGGGVMSARPSKAPRLPR